MQYLHHDALGGEIDFYRATQLC